MTLEQAKKIIPNNDYVIYQGQILKVISISTSGMYAKVYSPNKKHVIGLPTICLETLGEYRGSFTSDVLPPKAIEEDGQKEYSIDVFINIDGELTVGYFSYTDKKWVVYSDNYFFVDENKTFKWIFKPDYL